MEHAASVLRTGFIQWETASRKGLLQGIDARIKVLFLILFIVLVSLKKTILSEGAIGLFLFGLAMLSLRVMNSLSVSLLVFATTSFMEFMKALKILRVPDVFLMTITLSYKYIFIFASTVYDMHLAKKSRLVGAEKDREARRWIAGRIAFMYHKSRQRCEEVFKAMVSRGLSDSVKLQRMQPLSIRDWFATAGLLIAVILFFRI